MAATVQDYLEALIDKKLKEAKSLTETAEKGSRSLTEDEKHRVEMLLEDVTRHKSELSEIVDRETMRKQIDEMIGPMSTNAEAASDDAVTVGDAFVKSDGYAVLRGGGMAGAKWSSGPIEFKNWVGPFYKALVNESTSNIVAPDFRPGIQALPQRRLTVAQLFGQGQTSRSTVTNVQETTFTNAAAATSEGAAKPESTLVYTTVTEPVVKIATFLPVTDEFLEDVDAVRSYLDSRLALMVSLTEEAQLLEGNGTSPNLSGITDRNNIQTGTTFSLDADDLLDAIFRAITEVRWTGLLEPDAIVIHPNDWAQVRLQKDLNGQYFGGGPFTGAYGTGGGMAPDNVWGLNVVVTPAITLHTAIVGAFQTGATIYRRTGLTVEASNSHEDFFRRNMTAIRAEERLALAVHRPQAFFRLTGLDALYS